MATDVLGERFGFDLRFRDSDLVVRANGDVQLTEGSESVTANIERELVTVLGELFWRPNYGIGVPERLNLQASSVLLSDLSARIRQALEDKPQVREVVRVSVQLGAATGQVDVDVVYQLDTGEERLSLSLPGVDA
jgi:phage baseplate assembly protein W